MTWNQSAGYIENRFWCWLLSIVQTFRILRYNEEKENKKEKKKQSNEEKEEQKKSNGKESYDELYCVRIG